MKKLRFVLFVGIIFLISQTAQVENNLWPTSNGNFQSHKYSNLKKINEKNTSKLEVAWVYNNGFKAELKPFRTTSQLTPIFTGTSVITSSLDGYLISINPVNGVENWRTKLRRPVGRRARRRPRLTVGMCSTLTVSLRLMKRELRSCPVKTLLLTNQS